MYIKLMSAQQRRSCRCFWLSPPALICCHVVKINSEKNTLFNQEIIPLVLNESPQIYYMNGFNGIFVFIYFFFKDSVQPGLKYTNMETCFHLQVHM